MKTLIIATTALAGMALPAAALAQDATGTVTIDGVVAVKCVIEPTASISLGELADADGFYNLVADGQSVTLDAWCNGAASTMAVGSSPIVLQGGPTPPAGFTDTVNFTGTATVDNAAGATVSASDSTTAPPSAPGVVGLFADEVQVTLSASSTNGSRLMAGDYEGSVTVTLTPAS